LQRLAARAGVVQIGNKFGLDEIERSYGALELFLKTIVSDAVTLAAHRVSPPLPHNGFPVVTPKHILAGGPAADRYGVCLVGTGRLQLKEQIVHRYQHCGFENEYMKHAESREHVLSSASYDGVRTQNETVFEPKEWRKYHGCRSVEEFRETKRAVKQQKEDDMKKTVVEREEEAKRNAKEQKAEQTHVATTAQKVKMFHEKSLALIRRMQQSTERIIPFSVMASLIAGSVPEWAVGVRWSPVAINLIDFMAEHYLVYLYEVSNMNAINRKHTHVTANDIHLANYLRSTGRSI
jgi:histone H3/H4